MAAEGRSQLAELRYLAQTSGYVSRCFSQKIVTVQGGYAVSRRA
jgi:hypothetical protein